MSQHLQTKGLSFVAVHTTILGNPRFMDLSDTAKLVYLLMIVHSGDQGGAGDIYVTPKHVARVTGLDGGPAAAEAATDELIDAGMWERTGPDSAVIVGWDRYQVDFGGSATRAASNRRAAYERAHRDGVHDSSPKDGCPSCAPAAEDGHAAPSTGPDHPSRDDDTHSLDTETQRIIDAARLQIRTELLTTPDPGRSILRAYEQRAPVTADKHPDAPGLLGRLREAIVRIAIDAYAPAADASQANAIVALHTTHGEAVLHHLLGMAGKDVRNPVAYLRTCLAPGGEVHHGP